jgi:hypothetical protein
MLTPCRDKGKIRVSPGLQVEHWKMTPRNEKHKRHLRIKIIPAGSSRHSRSSINISVLLTNAIRAHFSTPFKKTFYSKS